MDSHQTKATHFQFVSIHGESFDYPTIPVVRTRRQRKFQKQETYRRGWLLRITDGRANPLMDRKVVGVVFFGVVAMFAVVTPPQLLDVVWCSAVVVVVGV